MTPLARDGGAPPPRRWYLRPRVALPAVALVVALLAVLTPEPTDGRSGDTRLTTHSTSPNGASILYDLAGRLGWNAQRREARGVPDDPRAIYVLLDPPLPLTAIETHAVLEHVRRGGGLLYVMAGRGALDDSLHVRRGNGNLVALDPDAARTPASAGRGARAADTASTAATEDDADDHACTRGRNGAAPMWPDGEMRLWTIRWWRHGPPDRLVVFARHKWTGPGALGARIGDAAAVGFDYGRGRVVLVADPDLFRNDVLRVCAWDADVTAVRMLEYLSETARGRVVFDEYHQGYGAQASMARAVAVFLTRTTVGHAVAQLAAAGLVLLLAVAPRGVPPTEAERIQRRSPIEHVGALARAYIQAGATRTAAALLVRGVRRRVDRTGGVPATRDHDAFLRWAAERAPERVDDVVAIRRALAAPVPRRELEAVGAALRRLEAALTAPRR